MLVVMPDPKNDDGFGMTGISDDVAADNKVANGLRRGRVRNGSAHIGELPELIDAGDQVPGNPPGSRWIVCVDEGTEANKIVNRFLGVGQFHFWVFGARRSSGVPQLMSQS